ncbi:MAG TPA: PrsW family glutamic-type intramembrane protease [Anaerolineales bacterium]|nr:PrsW family glutamic-type intramembrane protease [Anaerolineales bacterium]
MISAIAFAVAALIPLGFLFAVKSFDFYQTGSAKFIIYSGVWGILSYFFAAQINPALVNQHIFSTDTVVRFVAPVLEEILKGLILLYLIRHPDFKYFLDGAIYGFTAGIGFAIFENFEYISAHPSTALVLAISRVLSTNLIHATGSALIGIALGLARFNRLALFRALSLIGGVGLAIAIHSGFNNMVSEGAALVFALAAGLGGAGIIAAAAMRGLQDEKGWVHQNIGLTRGVTSGEASVVQRLEDVDELLAPLAKRFGEDKALQIEKFLFMQAQLAIQGKMLEKMQDERMRLAIQAQIRELDQKMNKERKAVGAYCMLYLRNIFPASDTQLWNLLQQRVTRNKGEAGTGLWMTLDQRMKPKPAMEKQD